MPVSSLTGTQWRTAQDLGRHLAEKCRVACSDVEMLCSTPAERQLVALHGAAALMAQVAANLSVEYPGWGKERCINAAFNTLKDIIIVSEPPAASTKG